jgi:hypothetical protein
VLRVSDDGPMTGLSTSTGAVVRKPAGKEPAGCGAQRCCRLYGDFDTAVEDAAADNVAGGVIAEPRGGGGGARVAGQQGIFARDYSGTRPAQSRVS